ncbi:ferrous iron transport protein A [Desulfohalotomaculum tongense]|uniref:FeoA family protein n=1 Tax=Desulforadius tongensis TaxID=1216062 RepID=UPI00195AD3BA|nr:FeoA family protein [Desulforadius tongensis]MBM7854904.1 ferrous iron transport protein A [Desulforadius tongensis]
MAGSKTLNQLPVGSAAVVRRVNAGGIMQRRLLDLGLVPGTRVEAVGRSPLGDPIAYNIRGAVIALRQEESSLVLVELES